jgi:ABC-type transport system involved in multi-copper enzyme maturation permease subunit
MKSSIRHALILDAFYQVLDNKIFRLLLFLVLGVVAASFVIGFREDRLDILFGLQSIAYDDLLRSLGVPGGAEDAQKRIIQGVQSLITGFLGGALGMVFCVSATAFFVPRMLEKGSADIVFSKPVSRLRLMLSRYVAGLMFVTILAILLVGGVYLGLAVTSGFHDSSFLWSALTLVYLYALLHSVSLLVGVLTRSTVATILIAIVFFWGTGCVHTVWKVRSFVRDSQVSESMRDLAPEERAASDGDEDENLPGIVRFLLDTFDVAHYVLPKTSDAPFVSRKLRNMISEPAVELVDEEGKLSIRGLPRAFERVEPRSVEVDLDSQPAQWTLDGDRATIEIRRETRKLDDPDRGPRRQSLSGMGRAITDEITARSSKPPERTMTAVDRVSAMELVWAEDGAQRRTVLIAYGDWLYRVELRCAPGADEKIEWRFKAFLERFSVAREKQAFADENEWYESRFGWTAPLPYNVWFSIGSSLAFALLMLSLAWWRLSRIDF